MKEINYLTEKSWYFQGFNGVPALLHGPAWSMVRDMPKFLNFGYSVCIEYFSNDVCYFLYGWDDLHRINNELQERFKSSKNFLFYLLKSDEKICKKTLKQFKILGKKEWSTASLEELYTAWGKANELYAYLLSVSHIVEGFTLTTEEKIRTLVKELFSGQNDLLLLTTPVIHSFVSREHYNLCLIAREIKKKGLQDVDMDGILSNRKIAKKILHHQKKYYWKLNSYTSSKFLDSKDFVSELKETFNKGVDFEKFINDFESLPKKLAEKKKLMKKIENQELLDLLEIADTLFIIHDRRKEYMTQSIIYLELILKEIASKFKIPLSYLHYILPAELEQLPEIVPELEKRRKSSLYVFLPQEEPKVFVGKDAELFWSKLNKNKEIEDVTEIKGNCASVGKVTGTVKVCRGESELVKMQEGDILVACMTQPEFLPAMKKAKAVITDEGGLTCHAAIIARELNIPCVIGTKIATKVLKDGDIVEVDASKGVVTIIPNPANAG
ncbi:MAG: Phosphoenolpyruvate synthase/pyruvate phosphate dikinase [Candidatus Magasanikbacteria bacterium GW2011_GWC2_37_14]|uniref:Phosphoenolpyruvate synthase/pyruvate phosphate dikinase n=1 Tax=Candidatus Magasanikbacteria bacterium GW2011_GWC2_37_14 TaxID=1619046 RepID=A0A0G0GPU6_9BACT|nr:MAG: Phosphoenolpyruvate synthase/pyruvate phosphate dikinase [Candidatus Magasanikbacteria bacterium GW2011_GWC2_37_14]